MKLPEPFRKAARAARRAGWTIERTRGGHLKWIPPAGEWVITPASPSVPSSIPNTLALLRRAGLEF
jgi:predicted RNA binding protein YcfA (HicA-like mRNA interferase family)